MKHCFLPTILAALVFIACDHDWKYIIITNESDCEITFKFKNVEGEKELLRGESLTFDSYWTTELDYYTHDKRVLYSYTSDYDSVSGTFKNRPSLELRVKNTLDIPANLSADGWMDNIGNILPGNEDHTGKIFTDKPVFSVSTDSFPATAQYQIIDKVMYVTISYKL